MKGRVRDIGIILKISNYSDSSLILHAICGERGLISIIAKGQRGKEKCSALLTLGEYEFVMYEPIEAGMYLLAEASPLRETSLSAFPEAWAAGICGAELLQAILVPPQEHTQYLKLLRDYLEYLETVPTNSILIFWRLWRRVMQLLGVPLDFSHCALCGKDLAKPQWFRQYSGEMLCFECADSHVDKESCASLRDPVPAILSNLPNIGNHLEDYRITRKAAGSINALLLASFSFHLQHDLRLKSIGVLEQFYP
jgi:DNA repair protein RecO